MMWGYQSEKLRKQLVNARDAMGHLEEVCKAQKESCQKCLLYISDCAHSSCLRGMLRRNIQDAEAELKKEEEQIERERAFVQLLDLIKTRVGVEGDGWEIAIERDPDMYPTAIRIRRGTTNA